MLASVLLLSSLAGLALAALPSDAPEMCLWMAKEPVPGDCVDNCVQFCKDNLAGEYFCTGQHVHKDTTTFTYDSSDSTKYNYCFCQRSMVTRTPNKWCGPNLQPCPPAGDFVDGTTNLVAGAQGDLTAEILNTTSIEDDDVDATCDDTLFAKLRYMFKKSI